MTCPQGTPGQMRFTKGSRGQMTDVDSPADCGGDRHRLGTQPEDLQTSCERGGRAWLDRVPDREDAGPVVSAPGVLGLNEAGRRNRVGANIVDPHRDGDSRRVDHCDVRSHDPTNAKAGPRRRRVQVDCDDDQGGDHRDHYAPTCAGSQGVRFLVGKGSVKCTVPFSHHGGRWSAVEKRSSPLPVSAGAARGWPRAGTGARGPIGSVRERTESAREPPRRAHAPPGAADSLPAGPSPTRRRCSRRAGLVPAGSSNVGTSSERTLPMTSSAAGHAPDQLIPLRAGVRGSGSPVTGVHRYRYVLGVGNRHETFGLTPM
jgi:hypothetical protein